MVNAITVATPPDTNTLAAAVLASMAAQSGVLTDYNKGSQIRTLSEAIGMIGEMQGVISNAEAFQAIVYSGFSVFGITQNAASSAVGQITFATGFSTNSPPASTSVLIPSGTVGQTLNGIQFATTQTAVLPAGSVSINVPIQAVQTGTPGNVAAGTITQLISGLPYPLSVSNLYPTSGGAPAESAQSVLARFTAVIAAITGATPVAIANACIGVAVPSTGETVKYATVYEPWIVQMSQGVSPLTPGYDVYVDNGSGSASQNLLNAVTSALNGVYPTNPGNRPAGVPYTVNAVNPLGAIVSVTGAPFNALSAAQLTTAVQSAMSALFGTLLFGASLSSARVTAAVANAVSGGVSGLTVVFENGSGTVITELTPLAYERIILQTLTINFGA